MVITLIVAACGVPDLAAVPARLAWQKRLEGRLSCCGELELGTPMNASIAESDEVITRGWRDACIHNLSSLGLASLVLQAPHTP
tara:strand:+ start:400 stop:651 length:252 start_codon:yes stop_codon:yes gene_type:complete